MFAQAVYLMFAAVYVSKEAVEHFLLHSDSASAHKHAGGAHAGVTGHHHHLPEGGAIGCVFLAHPRPYSLQSVIRLDVPVFLITLALLSTVGTAFVHDNHSMLSDGASCLPRMALKSQPP